MYELGKLEDLGWEVEDPQMPRPNYVARSWTFAQERQRQRFTIYS